MEFANVQLSTQLQELCSFANSVAAEMSHRFLTTEHILYAYTKISAGQALLEQANIDIEWLALQLEEALEEHAAYPEASTAYSSTDEDAQEHAISISQSPSLIRVFDHMMRTALQQNSTNYGTIKVGVVELFLSLYAAGEQTYSVQLLNAVDLPEATANTYFKKNQTSKSTAKSDKTQAKSTILDQLTIKLTSKALAHQLDPVVGRNSELDRLTHILCRRKKCNPLLIGEPGVGKTSIVEGLAQRIAEAKVPEQLLKSEIFSLNVSALTAGTKMRGDFEEKMNQLITALRQQPNAILFIDEIQLLFGAGASTGSAGDASSLLKPILTDSTIKVIGATTFEEAKKHLEKDPAFVRRFQRITVDEPSEDETIQILEGLKPAYEKFHELKLTTAHLQQCVQLSQQYLHDRKLPDKAIDLMDEIATAASLQKTSVSDRIIRETVAKIAKIPVQLMVDDTDFTSLSKLEPTLLQTIFGQNAAVNSVTRCVKRAKLGFKNRQKPIGSFLFTGPTGVGKTELAKQLAIATGSVLQRFDMSEYMEKHAVARLIGAPPGYVGFDQGGLLTEAISKTPNAVVLLDEIEKAHPDLFNILLQVMDNGTLTDTNGKVVSFRNTVIIMTSNTGARELTAASIGFGAESLTKPNTAVSKTFSPEFRNRLDAIIEFKTLDAELMTKLVDKFIGDLSQQLQEHQLSITLDESAVSYFATNGYHPQFGARPLARLIQEKLSDQLADRLIDGELTRGDQLSVSCVDNEIIIGQTKESEKMYVSATAKN
jgi:ATP-dependent Clp protease ATP-binding subunit ClpA